MVGRGLIEAVLDLFTAGVRAYKRKQKQDRLEKENRRLSRLLKEHKAALENYEKISRALRDREHEKSLEVKLLRLEHRKLYNRLREHELALEVARDKRELDGNPYGGPSGGTQ